MIEKAPSCKHVIIISVIIYRYYIILVHAWIYRAFHVT